MKIEANVPNGAGRILPAIITVLLLAVCFPAHATTIWKGLAISFTHEVNGAADQLTPGVAFDRGSTGGLYNSVTETGAVSGTSPADTEWAIGNLVDYATLDYYPCPLEQGNHPPGFVGTNFVVHLISEDIYLALTLTAWGGAGESGDTSFSYNRSTPFVTAPTPSVTFTNPPSGTVLAGPANLKLGASATVSSGTVTNVQFFANAIPLGSVNAAPFNLTSGALAANTYQLTAVATAAGISGTSAAVTVSVVTPVPVTLSAPQISGHQLTFNYAANAGLSYVLQTSTNLVDWLPWVTNRAVANPVSLTNTINAISPQFYRVGRLPNP
jgi:hypothetical protein